jgi:hypothetical protein
MFGKKKNKNCTLCSHNQNIHHSLCMQCLKIKNHIRNYGVINTLDKLNLLENKPTAPLYNS